MAGSCTENFEIVLDPMKIPLACCDSIEAACINIVRRFQTVDFASIPEWIGED